VVSLAREARRAARIAGFGAITATLLPGLVTHERVAAARDRAGVRRRWVAAWAGSLLRIFGVRALVRDVPAPAPAGRGRLIVANHRSTADILLLLRVFGGRMVSRADLSGWPLVGVAARAAGTLFVDRADAASGATAVRAIRTRLAEGDTVIVFPEGTTFPDDAVRPFHAGAFVAAARSGAEVLPVGLAYQTGSGAAFVGETFPQHLARMAAATPSRVALMAGAPLPTESRKAAALRDAAHAEVQRLVTRARALVDGGGADGGS
jgi:1-acyl-sn-glycerol-3-phosphate acyltransferase